MRPITVIVKHQSNKRSAKLGLNYSHVSHMSAVFHKSGKAPEGAAQRRIGKERKEEEGWMDGSENGMSDGGM